VQSHMNHVQRHSMSLMCNQISRAIALHESHLQSNITCNSTPWVSSAIKYHVQWHSVSHMCNHTWITCNGTPWVSCAITYHVQRHSMSLMWCVHTCSHICCVQLHLQFEHASSSSYLLRATTLAIWTRTQDTCSCVHQRWCTWVYIDACSCVHQHIDTCSCVHQRRCTWVYVLVYIGVHRPCSCVHQHIDTCSHVNTNLNPKL
jgi:hypothetical protein